MNTPRPRGTQIGLNMSSSVKPLFIALAIPASFAIATFGCGGGEESQNNVETTSTGEGESPGSGAGSQTVGSSAGESTTILSDDSGAESSSNGETTTSGVDGTTGNQPSSEPAVTQGLGGNDESCAIINSCPGMFTEARCGTIEDVDGNTWAVPTAPSAAPACTDLFNDCTGTGDNPNWEDEVETVSVGDGGESVTGFIHGDNYFELYVNGQSICQDPIAFTPFNSNVVRFSAERPVTYAVRLVDWEEHLGVGMEYDQYNVGDGGFAAAFSDGTVTGADWKCQVLYTSPVDDSSCVQVDGASRDSTGCSNAPRCQGSPETCYGLHWQEPADWAQPGFDDSSWPSATIFSEAQVNPKPAFTNYPTEFGGAEFIWGPNLVLDNEIVCRITVE